MYLNVPTHLASAVEKVCANPNALEKFEKLAVSGQIEMLPLLQSEQWQHFSTEVLQVFEQHDCAALRGFPSGYNGAALLLAALTIGESLRTYRDGKVSKHFKMSPWTLELSHTTRVGEFHTDLNTEQHPPAITAIQCLKPDPGSPDYGVTRVARLTHLLDFASRETDSSLLRFLEQDTVTMLNDRSQSSWSGKIVESGLIRYHPETIRAAARQSGKPLNRLAQDIARVDRAALSVSKTFALEEGDILIISNHRALHSRGECSVVFKNFPTDFHSRHVSVLHAVHERRRL